MYVGEPVRGGELLVDGRRVVGGQALLAQAGQVRRVLGVQGRAVALPQRRVGRQAPRGAQGAGGPGQGPRQGQGGLGGRGGRGAGGRRRAGA